MAAEKPSINTLKKMDRVGNAIYSILSSDVQLNQLVANRIYPVISRQREVYPLLTYSIITNNPSDTKTSASTVDQYRIQFDAYAEDYDQVHDIIIRLREVIDRYPHHNIAGVNLDGIRFIDQNDGYEEDAQLFRVTSDYYIRVKRVPIGTPIDPPYSGFDDGIVNECYDIHTFNFTLPAGDDSIDVGFLADSGHMVFAGETGPLVYGQEYTVSGNVLTITDAPFPSDIRIAVVRNRVRIRTFTQPDNTNTKFIGGIVLYPLMIFVDEILQVEGVDYTIDQSALEIEWLNHSGIEFDFKNVVNACQI
jgi:hypothetical protein